MAEAYIYDAVRTPRGKGRKDGSLHEVTALELATQQLQAIRDRNELDTGLVDDVILGCVMPIGEQGGDIARAAVLQKARNAKTLLDAVPAAAQRDPGYIFARVQWLRQNNKPEEAGKLILTAPKDPEALVNLDQWWLERRLLVRKLLDDHDPQAAYNVAREAAPPMRGVYRVDAHFTAGWVALRYLHNPKAKVKGTKMAFVGVKDDQEITNLIAYLKQYSK